MSLISASSLVTGVVAGSIVDELFGTIGDVQKARKVGRGPESERKLLFKLDLHLDTGFAECVAWSKAAETFDKMDLKTGQIIRVEMVTVISYKSPIYARGLGVQLKLDESSSIEIVGSGKFPTIEDNKTKYLECALKELVSVPENTKILLNDVFLKVVPRRMASPINMGEMRGSLADQEQTSIPIRVLDPNGDWTKFKRLEAVQVTGVLKKNDIVVQSIENIIVRDAPPISVTEAALAINTPFGSKRPIVDKNEDSPPFKI
ncbi:hypothetical protein M3Y96_00301600 [Aphelenchoides besseyi]|nr:hypothetical protein M3Y96_00301600 [Aphelenchoides besseyi]